ncbi:hypothetical protein [Peribacillus deserti]|uniref:Uncharacterized protein n=1 Tax=Peribacillus deserti TaxID=673318 RepID=A0A2N5MBN5_9BACI|nr:hypothetical protein [Peribacillus deserti]PLT31753.1 hypothetical protein CUU66_00900 [Peribacillus deserti]
MKLLVQNTNPHESISKLDMEFHTSFLRFRGIAKKFLMEIKFEIDLLPLRGENRALYFKVAKMKPLNEDWIKTKILNSPPLLSYIKGNMIINLNKFDVVRKVPLENIKHFELKDDKLWVRLGL